MNLEPIFSLDTTALQDHGFIFTNLHREYTSTLGNIGNAVAYHRVMPTLGKLDKVIDLGMIVKQCITQSQNPLWYEPQPRDRPRSFDFALSWLEDDEAKE